MQPNNYSGFNYSESSPYPSANPPLGIDNSNSGPAKLALVKPRKPLALIISLVAAIVIALIFIGLFVWKYLDWQTASTNLDGQIAKASALAVKENTTKLESDFAERERNPFKKFAGPVDYGELSFNYPKTWSVFIAKDAARGGDFEAYLHPDKVSPLGSEAIHALRVTIKNQSLDQVVKSFESQIKNGKLSLSVKKVNQEPANLYQGELPNKRIGSFAIFRIRDKTVILQTDAKIFEADFEKILQSVSFNK